MYQHPLNYTKEQLENLIAIPIKIYVGKINSTKIDGIIEGVILDFSLAANPPHLPGDIKFQNTNGDVEVFNIFQVKRFSDIEEEINTF